jgi:predicted chitinase
MKKIDIEKFLFLYQNEYGGLEDQQLDGLRFLLEQLIADEKINDIRHAAYMLATTKHECAGKWQPIAEYGKGTGRKYGIPDSKTGQTYYGRGYVQLTWKENYQAMGKICGLDLVNNPDMAMNAGTAYQIMSHGMRNGSFTGKRLSMYIHDNECDFVSARKIINGLDCAERIADYSKRILWMLTQAEVTE